MFAHIFNISYTFANLKKGFNMSLLTKGLFLPIVILLLSGCTAKTINQSMEYTWLKNDSFQKASRATVIVVPMDEWSVNEEDLATLEDIREEIVDELDDLNIKNGRALTIKILVRHFWDNERFLGEKAPGNINATIEYYDANDNLVAKKDILTKVDTTFLDMSFSTESEQDGFIRAVIENTSELLNTRG